MGPLDMACPACGVLPREWCRSPQGVPYASGYVHPERVEAVPPVTE